MLRQKNVTIAEKNFLVVVQHLICQLFSNALNMSTHNELSINTLEKLSLVIYPPPSNPISIFLHIGLMKVVVVFVLNSLVVFIEKYLNRIIYFYNGE